MPHHAKNNSTPLKKIHFINDNVYDDNDDDDYDNNINNNDNKIVGKFHNLSNDMKNVMIKSDGKLFSKNTNNINNNKMVKSLQFQSTTDIPEIKEVPIFMRIPNLWNFNIEEPSSNRNYKKENDESNENKSSSSSEDWEIV